MPVFTLLDAVQSRIELLLAAAFALVGAACSFALRARVPDRHKRGALIHNGTSRRRRRSPLEAAPAGGLTLANITLAHGDETKHFKIIGTTGTGKSTAIHELLGGALARGDRAVIADPDGGYRDRFFNRYRGDVILNPFERDSLQWNPFAEISNGYDVDELSAGLIANSADAAGNEWRGYARTFLTSVIRRCQSHEGHGSAELWRLLAVASAAELRPLVAGSPAQSFLDCDNARMFGSIRAVTLSAIAAFETVQRQRAPLFSIRQWVRRDAAPGVLFIPYKAGQIAALRSMIATWMRIAIFECMNGAENHDQRLWFVIDELDALGAIEGLKDALARLRKFGGRCVLGFQSIAQVSGTYGVSGARTIVENCGNTLILRCSASEHGGTSEFASKLIGDREIIRRQTSRGNDRGGASMRRSRNISEQHVIEAAVMAAQIEQLADFRGYFKAASAPDWKTVSLEERRDARHGFSK